MKLLLTSAGVKNQGINEALLELLGKPIEESSALCITTASYGHAPGGIHGAYRFVTGRATTPMTEFGWKSMGLLELSALTALPADTWVPVVRETDILLVNGGDALFLAHWMRLSGLADLLPSLDIVWMGLSAGSMVMTPRIGEDFKVWEPPGGGDETLGVVDFSICPHLAPDGQPGNSMADAEEWAAKLSNPAYAVDDETAFKIVDGEIEIVGGGEWRFFPSD